MPVASSLAALEVEARRQLEILNIPPKPWVKSREGVLDVALIGAGMGGVACAIGLTREGIGNFHLIDAAKPGHAGPWASYARMKILRSPKHICGPEQGIPALAFRSWYEAAYGEAAWTTLYKIDPLDWQRYLDWLCGFFAFSITQGVAVTHVSPSDAHFTLTLAHGESVRARRLILAPGREHRGTLLEKFPELAQVDAARFNHSADTIDFTRLVGKRVGVIGAVASAFDNASTALEAGAAHVSLLVRRPYIPQINKSKWFAFQGAFRGAASLSDDERIEILDYIASLQVPPPHESVHRFFAASKARGDAGAIALDCGELKFSMEGDAIRVTTRHGEEKFDHLIFATGFSNSLDTNAELKDILPHVRRWRDVRPGMAAQHHPIADAPYVGAAGELLPLKDDGPAWVSRIWLLHHSTRYNLGPINGDIPPLSIAAENITRAVAASLFKEDFSAHFADGRAWAEMELENTPLYVPPEISNP
jgi:FAD-dependent urate hydroxylase